MVNLSADMVQTLFYSPEDSNSSGRPKPSISPETIIAKQKKNPGKYLRSNLASYCIICDEIAVSKHTS